MTRRAWLIPLMLLAMLSGLSSGPVRALTPQDLINQGRLQVQAVYDSEPPYFQQAPLIMAVEIATPRWFGRGPRVRDFRVPGAVVLPVSSFADKLTRRVGGESWTVQRWRYRIFPREIGALKLPELSVFVSVNHESGAIVEGEIRLRPEAVKIVPPPGLKDRRDWVAATSLTAEAKWEGQRDSYRVGDAITLTRVLTIANAPAMMIPPPAAMPADASPGLSLYQAPPEISDRQDRGRLVGVRRETVIATMEAPGAYTLPERHISWFNTDTKSWEDSVIPAYHFEVQSAAYGRMDTDSYKNSTAPEVSPLMLLAWLTLGLVSVFGAYRLRHHRRLQAMRRWLLRQDQRHRYQRALQQRRAGDALATLSLAVSQRGENTIAAALEGDSRAETALRELLAAAYGSGDTAFPDVAATKHLWRTATATRSRSTRAQSVLSLNPGSSVHSTMRY